MIVDDHSIVRVGLKQLLEQSGEFEVVGQAADGEEAVRVAADVSPDVVVMDVIMPRKDGVEACRERLLSTVRDAVSGELRAPVEVVRRAFEEIRGGGRAGDATAAAGLTQREREILVSVSQGMSYARIAEARGIKPVTARNAIYGIQQKLGVGSMQELVLWSVRNGLLGD